MITKKGTNNKGDQIPFHNLALTVPNQNTDLRYLPRLYQDIYIVITELDIVLTVS